MCSSSSEASLIVPNFTVFNAHVYVILSFLVSFSFVSCLFFYVLAFHPALGMSLNRKRKQRSQKKEAEKRDNYMNCCTQK